MSQDVPGLNESEKVIKDKTTVTKEVVIKKHSKYSLEIDKFQLDKNGNPNKFKIFFAYFILLWAVISHSFEVVQAVKIYSEKNAKGVSLPAYCLWIFGSAVWLVYGVYILAIPNYPIIISAILGILLGVVLVVGISLYG